MRIALCLVLLVLAVPAWAQIPPVFELPEVTIPGRRPQPASATPASISVLTHEDLEALGIQTLAEALQLLPEVFVRTYAGGGALAEASIRGFGPGQVLVLLDGVPLNNVALGQTDLSTISLVGVQRIEVLRGPFAALAGSGALGGVINVVTGGTGGGVATRYGGGGERRISVTSERGPISVGLDAGGGEGYRPNSDSTDFTLRADLRLRSGFTLRIHHHRAELGTPGDVAAPTPFDRQSSDRTVVQGQWTAGEAVRARAYYTAETLVFATPFGSSTYRASLAGGEWQRQWSVGPQRVVVVGLEVASQRLDASVFGSAIVEDAVVGAGYVQYDAALSPRLLASVGARFDVHSRYGTAFDPRAGIVFDLDGRTRLRAAVGRTFRGPTFLHLFFPGCSNPGLMPESAWAVEVGVERISSGGSVGATAFVAEAANLISSGCPPLNIDRASVRGISLDGRTRLSGKGLLHINFTFQQAVDRSTGDALPRVPALAGNAAVAYRLTDADSLAAILRYVGPRRDVDFSVFPAATVDAAGYMDLGLRYQHRIGEGWTLTVGVDNALDARYAVVNGFPAPGRRMFVSAAGRF
ncbi:MAG TPA: TonB-dependent receptor [bacterium]